MRRLKRHGYLFPAIISVLGLLAPLPVGLWAQTSLLSANYPGPELPADKVSSLTWPAGIFWIRQVNGAGNDRLSLLPGRHAVTIAIRGIGTGETVLFFDALAGHSYEPRGYVDGSQAVVTIVDLATMESVSRGSGLVENRGYYLRGDDGHFHVVGSLNRKIGMFPDGKEFFIRPLFMSDLARDLGEATLAALLGNGYYRHLNAKGFALMDGPAKFMPNQHVDLFDKKNQNAAALYVGTGSPILSREGRLYALLENGEIAELATMTASQRTKVSGLGQKIAQIFSEMAVMRFSRPGFYFTHATGGELFVSMTVKVKGGKKEMLVIGEKTE